MKKIAVASLSVLAVAGQAFAADDAASSNLAQNQLTRPTADLDPEQVQRITQILERSSKSESPITVYGVVQADMNFADTQRKNVPDFSGEKVRLGVFVDGGIATGQVEIDLEKEDGTVDLRQAQLNIAPITVKHMGNEYVTTIALGGVRVGGATAIAPDAASTPTGYGRQDGIYLTQDINVGKRVNVQVGLGAFNQLEAVDLYGDYGPSNRGNGIYVDWTDLATFPVESFTGQSFNGNLAMMGTFKLGLNLDRNQTLQFDAYYGTQSEAEVVAPVPSANPEVPGSLSIARDLTHVEASLVYNHKAIFGQGGVISGNGIGLWYEMEDIGDTKKADKEGNGNSYSYKDTGLKDGYKASLIGLGVAGDTAPYLTNMIQRGDRLTYAAAFTYANFETNTNYFADNTKDSANVSQIALSVGYAVSTFEVAVNADFSTASEDGVFVNSSQTESKKDESRVYLTALYAF